MWQIIRFNGYLVSYSAFSQTVRLSSLPLPVDGSKDKQQTKSVEDEKLRICYKEEVDQEHKTTEKLRSKNRLLKLLSL